MPVLNKNYNRRIKAYKKKVFMTEELKHFLVYLRGHGVPISHACSVSFMPSTTAVKFAMDRDRRFAEDMIKVARRNPVRGWQLGRKKK